MVAVTVRAYVISIIVIENITILTISFALMIHLQPNLVWWLIIMSQSVSSENIGVLCSRWGLQETFKISVVCLGSVFWTAEPFVTKHVPAVTAHVHSLCIAGCVFIWVFICHRQFLYLCCRKCLTSDVHNFWPVAGQYLPKPGLHHLVPTVTTHVRYLCIAGRVFIYAVVYHRVKNSFCVCAIDE